MQLRAGINQVVSLLHERSHRGQTLRFILFLVLYFLGRFPQLFLQNSSFGQALLNPLHERLSFFITHSCCFLLQGFYPDIHVTDYSDEAAPPFRRKQRHLKVGGSVIQY